MNFFIKSIISFDKITEGDGNIAVMNNFVKTVAGLGATYILFRSINLGVSKIMQLLDKWLSKKYRENEYTRILNLSAEEMDKIIKYKAAETKAEASIQMELLSQFFQQLSKSGHHDTLNDNKKTIHDSQNANDIKSL